MLKLKFMRGPLLQHLLLALLPLLLLAHGCPQQPVVKPQQADLRFDPLHPGGFVRASNPKLGIEDNCMACHRFDNFASIRGGPAAEGQWDPAGARQEGDPQWLVRGEHPGGLLNWHSAGEYGCTVCHGGSGSALSYEEAAHADMRSAPEVEASCGVCHPGDYVPGAPLLSSGRSLLRELNCAACHQLAGSPSPPQPGPELTHVAAKLQSALLREWPNIQHRLKEGSRMPQFRLDHEELDSLMNYLGRPRESSPQFDDEALQPSEDFRQRGLDLVRAGRCANCHMLPRPVDAAAEPLWEIAHGSIGPDLRRIAERSDELWIADYLSRSHWWYPETRMPQYDYSAQERSDIAGWLISVSAEHTDKSPLSLPAPGERPGGYDAGLNPTAAEIAQGRSDFVAIGCAGCHKVDDPLLAARPVGPSLQSIGEKPRSQWPDEAQWKGRLYDYLLASVLDPASVGNELMPNYALNEKEASAIAVALLAERSSAQDYRAEAFAPKTFDAAAATSGDADSRLLELIRAYQKHPLPAQGSGPPGLSAAERSLAPQDCASCHREQYSDWKDSRHALAMGPGVTGQIIEWIAERPAAYFDCLRCHAPLIEQSHVRRVAGGGWEENPHFREELYSAGHSCVACHVRAHVRHGPSPPRSKFRWDSASVSAHPRAAADFLRDSRFCMDCHQFPASQRTADGGPPLQDTYAEWEAWRRASGDQRSCQDCHMPGGEHSFRGIHDAQYVADSVDIVSSVDSAAELLTAQITLHNRDNGHHLPTYVTPRIFLRGYFIDAGGKEIEGSRQQAVIGRDARTRPAADGNGSEWYSAFDTRVPAGGSFVFSYSGSRPPEATVLALEVFVEPDHFYHQAFSNWATQESRSSEGRALLQQAQAETEPQKSGYFLLQERHPLN